MRNKVIFAIIAALVLFFLIPKGFWINTLILVLYGLHFWLRPWAKLGQFWSSMTGKIVSLILLAVLWYFLAQWLILILLILFLILRISKAFGTTFGFN